MSVRNFSRYFSTALQRFVNSLTKGAGRLFSPTDDDYPKTDVQPFEGEIPK